MTLRTSLWLDRPEIALDDTPGGGSGEFDVAIIGGGIVGSALAALLAEFELTTILLEANTVGSGTTGNSTAKATCFHGTNFSQQVDELGVDGARLVLDGDRAALDLIRRWASDGVVGTCESVTHWAWASSDDGAAKLHAEADAAAALGVPTRWAADGECPLGTVALGVDDQLLIEPAAMCRELVASAQARGLVLCEHARVVEVDTGDVVRLVTADGDEVRARHVVSATQVPILDRSLVFAGCSYHKSHAVAIECDDAHERFDGMYTGIDDDGLSVRPARTREGASVVVAAGDGHDLKVAEDGTHIDQLIAHARRLTGIETGDVTNAWLAHDAFPADGRPFVGPAFGNDNVYVATGFGGWGLARGIASAMVIAELIQGGHASWEHPFDARRLGAYMNRSTVMEALKTATELVRGRLQASAPGHVDQLAPGQGIVVRDGVRPVAVARGRDGSVHAVSATCTHMGCIVGHDPERDEWHCPCHGSRFALGGAVVCGPATEPLEPVELPKA